MRVAVFLALVGCGRIGFSGHAGGDDAALGDDAGDGGIAIDARPSGIAGPRYLIELDNNGHTVVIAGANGAVAVGEDFVGATTIAGHAFTGQAMFESGAVLWLDPQGTPASSTVIDSNSVCNLRQLGRSETGVISVGYSNGNATVPAYGPCAIATARQDGMAIAIDPAGAQTIAGHIAAISGNVQGWYAIGMHDGSTAVSGVYGTDGKLGSSPLPTTSSDENPYFARIDPATGEPRWLITIASASRLFAGPLDALGDDVCLSGSFVNTIDVLGTPMTSHGGIDAWVARVDSNGAPRFVTQIGSAGDEASTSQITVVATADGGCAVATTADGDLFFDLIFVAGGGSAFVKLDATGKAVAGGRAPRGLLIGRIGDKIYGAVPCTGQCAIAGASYMAVNDDIALVSFSNATATVIGAITGSTTLFRFATLPPDAVAVSFAAGTLPTAFGALTLTAVGSALAVLGL